jgi:hypothetical protein
VPCERPGCGFEFLDRGGDLRLQVEGVGELLVEHAGAVRPDFLDELLLARLWRHSGLAHDQPRDVCDPGGDVLLGGRAQVGAGERLAVSLAEQEQVCVAAPHRRQTCLPWRHRLRGEVLEQDRLVP